MAKLKEEHLIGALLSQMSYYGNSKALGWAGVPKKDQLSEEEQEAFRKKFLSDEAFTIEELLDLRRGFWKDDLQVLLLDELDEGTANEKARELLAQRLWCALYVQADTPTGHELQTKKAESSNALSAKDMTNKVGSFTRKGVYRSSDIHCTMFAKVWDKEHGFGEQNSTSYVIYRGTENSAKALQAGGVTFFKDYLLKSYRNFAKAYAINYKDVTEGFIRAKKESGEPLERCIMVGHSLGGSLAIEGALQNKDLAKELGVQVEGYTYGAPKTGSVGLTNFATGLPLIISAYVLMAMQTLAQKSHNLGMELLEHVGIMKPQESERERAYGNPDAKKKVKIAGQFGAASALDNHVAQEKALATAGSWLSKLKVLPPLKLIDMTVQSLFNLADAWGTKNKNLLIFGNAVKEPSKEVKKEVGDRLVHFAHGKDIIPKVGSALGFEIIGTKHLMNSYTQENQSSWSPVLEHDKAAYVQSVEEALRASMGDKRTPVGYALVRIRTVVDELVNLQAFLHKKAMEEGRDVEMAFLEHQMHADFLDEHEAPRWSRAFVARSKETVDSIVDAIPEVKVLKNMKQSLLERRASVRQEALSVPKIKDSSQESKKASDYSAGLSVGGVDRINGEKVSKEQTQKMWALLLTDKMKKMNIGAADLASDSCVLSTDAKSSLAQTARQFGVSLSQMKRRADGSCVIRTQGNERIILEHLKSSGSSIALSAAIANQEQAGGYARVMPPSELKDITVRVSRAGEEEAKGIVGPLSSGAIKNILERIKIQKTFVGGLVDAPWKQLSWNLKENAETNNSHSASENSGKEDMRKHVRLDAFKMIGAIGVLNAKVAQSKAKVQDAIMREAAQTLVKTHLVEYSGKVHPGAQEIERKGWGSALGQAVESEMKLVTGVSTVPLDRLIPSVPKGFVYRRKSEAQMSKVGVLYRRKLSETAQARVESHRENMQLDLGRSIEQRGEPVVSATEVKKIKIASVIKHPKSVGSFRREREEAMTVRYDNSLNDVRKQIAEGVVLDKKHKKLA